MQIRKIVTKIYEDEDIEILIRKNGIRKTARLAGIQSSNLNTYLSGRLPMPDKVYWKIRKIFSI